MASRIKNRPEIISYLFPRKKYTLAKAKALAKKWGKKKPKGYTYKKNFIHIHLRKIKKNWHARTIRLLKNKTLLRSEGVLLVIAFPPGSKPKKKSKAKTKRNPSRRKQSHWLRNIAIGVAAVTAYSVLSK